MIPFQNPLSWTIALGVLGLSLMAASAEPVAVGAPGPTANSQDQNGKAVDLAAVYKEGMTLVYFYPKADTPGCTKQACSLRDAFEELTDKGVRVIGVSRDSVEDQKAFEEKFKLPFTLLADKAGTVVKAFGVPEIKPGFPSRQAFLIGGGKVVWRDLKASTAQQAEDVLAVLAEQAKSGGA